MHQVKYLLLALAVVVPLKAMEMEKGALNLAQKSPTNIEEILDYNPAVLANDGKSKRKRNRNKKKKNSGSTINRVSNPVAALVRVDKQQSPEVLGTDEQKPNIQIQAPTSSIEEQLKALVTGVISAHQGFWEEDFDLKESSKTEDSASDDEEENESSFAKELKKLIKKKDAKLENLMCFSLALNAQEGFTKKNQEITQLIVKKLNKKYGTSQMAEEKMGIIAKPFYYPILPSEAKVDTYYNDSKSITDNVITPLATQIKDKVSEKEKNQARQEAIALSIQTLKAENEGLQLTNNKIAKEVDDATLVVAYFNTKKAENKTLVRAEYLETLKNLTELKENKATIESSLTETEKKYPKKELAVEQKKKFKEQIQKITTEINVEQAKADDLKNKLDKINQPGTAVGSMRRSGWLSWI